MKLWKWEPLILAQVFSSPLHSSISASMKLRRSTGRCQGSKARSIPFGFPGMSRPGRVLQTCLSVTEDHQHRKRTYWVGVFKSWSWCAELRIYNSMTKKQTIRLITGQRIWTDIFPKKIYEWPTDTWKNVQHHESSGQRNQNSGARPSHNCYNGCDQKDSKYKRSQGCGRGTVVHCWWECRLVQSQWKTISRLLKKLRIESPHDPAMTFLGIYIKNMQISIQK